MGKFKEQMLRGRIWFKNGIKILEKKGTRIKYLK